MMISNHLNVPVLQAQLVGDGSAFAVTLNCVTCSAVVPLDVAKKKINEESLFEPFCSFNFQC